MGLYSRLEAARATPENPRYSLSDPATWDILTDGARSSSGVAVNDEKALGVSGWWRGITLVSSTFARVGCYTYRRLPKGGKERATDHPIFSVLRYRWNAWTTAFTGWQTIQGHVLSKGNGYALIVRDLLDRVLELILLDPARVTPKREEGGEVYYEYSGGSKGSPRTIRIAGRDILHLKGYGYDGIQGYSVVQKARDALGGELAKQRHGNHFFRHGARPGVILKRPADRKPLEPDAERRVLSSFNATYAGEDAFKTMMLQEGMECQVLSFNAKDSQLIESQMFGLIAIANYIGVPAGKIGHTGRTSYASVEQENLSFLTDSMDAHFISAELELREKLLSPEEQASDSVVIEFLREALIRADLKTENEALKTALGGAPWMKINEVRAMKNLPPVDEGDALAMPLNMTPAGAEEDPPPPADPMPVDMPKEPVADEEGDRLARVSDALERIVRDAKRRMIARLAASARKASRNPDGFGAWLDSIQADHQVTVVEALTLPVTALETSRGGDGVARVGREAGSLLGEFRAVCERVYDSPRSEFIPNMEAAMAALEKTYAS